MNLDIFNIVDDIQHAITHDAPTTIYINPKDEDSSFKLEDRKIKFVNLSYSVNPDKSEKIDILLVHSDDRVLPLYKLDEFNHTQNTRSTPSEIQMVGFTDQELTQRTEVIITI